MRRRDEDNRAAKAFRAPPFTLHILCGLKMRLLIRRMKPPSEQRLCARRRVKKQFLTRHRDRRRVKEPNSLSS